MKVWLMFLIAALAFVAGGMLIFPSIYLILAGAVCLAISLELSMRV